MTPVDSLAKSSAQRKEAGPAPLLSVLVVNWNGAAFLSGCLDSLRATLQKSCEVILVDNASTDNSLKLVEERPWIRLVSASKNLGFAGGNNLGLKECRGEYVLLLNNDTIVNGDSLRVLCEYLDCNPEVGVVQGKMLLPRFGDTLDVCGSFLTSLGLPYHYGYFKPDGPKYQRAYPVFSGKGACLMFRRALIEKVGGFLFEEEFFCYYEESDFCHRVWLAGYEVHFVPSPPIQHLMGATSGNPHSGFVLRHYLRNMAFSLMANLSLGSRLRILPLFFAVNGLNVMVSALRLKGALMGAHLGVFIHSIIYYPKILARRRLVKRIRRRSDKQIFARVLRTPRLEYFIKTSQGQIGEYVDDNVRC